MKSEKRKRREREESRECVCFLHLLSISVLLSPSCVSFLHLLLFLLLRFPLHYLKCFCGVLPCDFLFQLFCVVSSYFVCFSDVFVLFFRF